MTLRKTEMLWRRRHSTSWITMTRASPTQIASVGSTSCLMTLRGPGAQDPQGQQQGHPRKSGQSVDAESTFCLPVGKSTKRQQDLCFKRSY